MAFTPDGSVLLCWERAEERSEITTRWRPSDGTPLGRLSVQVSSGPQAGHGGLYYMMYLANDMREIYRTDADGFALELVGAFRDTVGAARFRVSPDEQHIVTSTYGDGHLLVWRLSDGALLRRLAAHSHSDVCSDVQNIAIAPDGQHMVSVGCDNHIVLTRLVPE